MKIFSQLRPAPVFVCTLLCFPGFLFQKSLFFLWIDVLFFASLSAAKKGRLRLLPPLLVLVSVVFFNLLNPFGKLLFSVGVFSFTQGALLSGLEKSAVLLGMVFLSQYGVSRDLQLPGLIGGLLSSMFGYFDKLNTPLNISGFSGLFDAIDKRLWAVFPPENAAKDPAGQEKKTSAAITETAIAVTGVVQEGMSPAQWLLTVLPLFPVYLLLILNLYLA